MNLGDIFTEQRGTAVPGGLSARQRGTTGPELGTSTHVSPLNFGGKREFKRQT